MLSANPINSRQLILLGTIYAQEDDLHPMHKSSSEFMDKAKLLGLINFNYNITCMWRKIWR
jgi:hypothetical protein